MTESDSYVSHEARTTRGVRFVLAAVYFALAAAKLLPASPGDNTGHGSSWELWVPATFEALLGVFLLTGHLREVAAACAVFVPTLFLLVASSESGALAYRTCGCIGGRVLIDGYNRIALAAALVAAG